jgi:hypothetical protein
MNADVKNRGLTIDSGGTFIPGGDGIGTTTVSDSGSAATYPGRVLFAQGSTNIIKVNPVSPAYTIVQSEVMGFGPNGTAKQINGGTIVISNTTATAFTVGQSFRIFRNSFNGGNVLNAGLNTTNSYPIMVPAAPGPGLAWDLSALIVPNISGNNGLIGISTVNTTPTNLTATFTLTGSNIVTELSWPSDYLGWKLQQQQNSIGVGISTNWTTVFDSLFNTDVFITNNLNVDTAFYRMVFP